MVSAPKSREIRALTRQVKQKAAELGADVVGIAPVFRFRAGHDAGESGVPSYSHSGYLPTDFYPSAQSVIVMGVGQLTGVMMANVSDAETTYPFGNYGYVHLNRLLNQISFDLARWLEGRGLVTVPLGTVLPARFRAEAKDDPSQISPLYGVFNLKRAAVLAGVGRRAKNGLVANPVFGTRIRLAAVITAATLEADPILEGSPCPPACTICMDACPTRAITPDGRVDHLKCYSDCGRRGITWDEAKRKALEKYPLDSGGSDYVMNDYGAIDSFGNRMCKVACMALCPLGENPSPALLRNSRGWARRNPPVDLSGWLHGAGSDH